MKYIPRLSLFDSKIFQYLFMCKSIANWLLEFVNKFFGYYKQNHFGQQLHAAPCRFCSIHSKIERILTNQLKITIASWVLEFLNISYNISSGINV